MDKMGIEMPLLAEGIKQKPDQVSGSSCQFVGNTEEQSQSEKSRLWETSDQMLQVLEQIICEEKKGMEEVTTD